MPEYVSKIRVPVRLARLGVPAVDGQVFLAPHAELHEGPETILECLNATARIVPFLPDDADAVLLVTREHVEWVEPAASVDARLVCATPWRPTREERVRVRLADGGDFEGLVSMEMPTEFNRLSDYLNGPEAFFPLRADAGWRLINKRRVVEILVRAAAPVPKSA